MIVMLVAITVNIDNVSSAVKDAAFLSGLVSLWLSGPGKWGLTRD